MNVMLLLEMARDGFGDRVAVGDRSTGMTYRQVFAACGAVAGRFTEMEVSHVGYLDVSTESLPIALFGSAWAGLPFVPLNYRLDDAALARLIGRIAPAVVVCDPSRYQSVESAPGVQSLDVSLLPGGRSGVVPAEWSYDGEEAAIVLFTSGTSGEPKAAVLRHRHLVSYVMSSTEFMSASDDEATLVSVPPYHIAGVAAILTSVYAGRRMVQLPRFDADAWIDLVVDQSVTHAMVVPTMLASINERLADRDISLETLRALSYGGGKMPRGVIERALDLLPGTDFVNAYGLTETSSTISILGPDDHRAARHGDDEAARRRLGSVGRPLPSIEIEIRDRDGVVVEAGSAGEIWVRGDQVAGEYVESGPGPETDGWFATRDEGWLDEQGYLFVTGRLDDVIIRGGENISPGEIEAVLQSHPGVASAACVGVPDDHWGEVVAAAVVPSGDVAVSAVELRTLVRETLRSTKVPEYIEFVSELPYNETGKLLRRVLRTELATPGSDRP